MKKKCPYCGYMNIAGADVCRKCLAPLADKDLPTPTTGDSIQRKIMTVSVAKILSGDAPAIVSQDDSIADAIMQMQYDAARGCVLVCNKKRELVGLVSVRDILLKVAGTMKKPSAVSVSKIMTKNPESVSLDATLAFVLHKMSIGRFRHVPVVDKGRPIGVLAMRDVISYLTTGKRLKSHKAAPKTKSKKK